jgi:hypothetical protein
LAIRFALVVLFGGLLGGCRQQGTLAGLPPIALDDDDLAAIDAQLVRAAGPATAGCTLVTTYDVTIVAAGAATKQHLVDRSCQPRKDRRGRLLQELAWAHL